MPWKSMVGFALAQCARNIPKNSGARFLISKGLHCQWWWFFASKRAVPMTLGTGGLLLLLFFSPQRKRGRDGNYCRRRDEVGKGGRCPVGWRTASSSTPQALAAQYWFDHQLNSALSPLSPVQEKISPDIYLHFHRFINRETRGIFIFIFFKNLMAKKVNFFYGDKKIIKKHF